MAERWQDEAWARDMWWSGKTTRRRFLGLAAGAAGALGATMLVPAPWREAFGQAKPFKIGTLQPLSGHGGGRRQDGAGRRADGGGPHQQGRRDQRPADRAARSPTTSRSPTSAGARRRSSSSTTRSTPTRAAILSNVCLACMPVYEEHKVVNMITVCLDTTITTTKCSRYTFRPFDYAPAQAVAAAPYLVNKIGKRWHIAYADYAWGQSTRDAYTEQISKAGGTVVETTGIPLGTADMTPFLSKVTGSFDGLFGIFFGPQGIAVRHPELRPGPQQEVPPGGRRSHRGHHGPAGARQQGRGVRRHRPLRAGPGGRPQHAAPQAVPRRRGGAPEADRPERPPAGPLRAVQLRGDQRPEDRHAEVRASRAARTR